LTERGEWVEVSTDVKESGFLRAGSLETDADRDARRKRAEKLFSFPAVFGVIAEDTDVMLAPFALGPRAGRLRKGETIRIHAVDHDWIALGKPTEISGSCVRATWIWSPDPRRPRSFRDR
jgi:hypothetical protein